MLPVYLDTNALIYLAQCSVGNPAPEHVHCGLRVQTLLDQSAPLVAVTPVGLIEFHDVLAKLWRSSDPNDAQFDQQWVEAEQIRLMSLISSGRIEILAPPSHMEEKALSFITMATSDYGMNFRAWDAIHLTCALQWAKELNSPVGFWTADKQFRKFIKAFPFFQKYIRLVILHDGFSQ